MHSDNFMEIYNLAANWLSVWSGRLFDKQYHSKMLGLCTLRNQFAECNNTYIAKQMHAYLRDVDPSRVLVFIRFKFNNVNLFMQSKNLKNFV